MSPRPGPRRPPVMFRLSKEAQADIEARAAAQGINRSEMIRRMLAYASKHMPEDWTDNST
jgi:hypothetical protein